MEGPKKDLSTILREEAEERVRLKEEKKRLEEEEERVRKVEEERQLPNEFR